MGVDTALYSGVSGLSATSNAMNVIGNNLANAQTTGYKADRSLFSDILASEVASASGSSQIGRGVGLATVDTVFEQGSFKDTGVSTDMAIDGDGFFMVSHPDQAGTKYTRDGSFRFDDQGYLVNAMGYRVQGYSIDKNGNANGQLNDIYTDLSGSIEPFATTDASFSTNLNQDSEVIDLANFTVDSSTGKNVSGITYGAVVSAPSSNEGDTVDLSLGDGTSLRVEYSGGSWSIDGSSTAFSIQADDSDGFTIVNDNNEEMSIDSISSQNNSPSVDSYISEIKIDSEPADGDNFSVTLNDGTTIDGTYDVSAWTWGDTGRYNSPDYDDSSNVLTLSTNKVFNVADPNTTSNFSTSLNVYDSLGDSHQLSVYFTKSEENQWSYNITAPGSKIEGKESGQLVSLTSGDLEFDENGSLISGGDVSMDVQWANGAADSSIDIALNLTQYSGQSSLVSKSQNGYASGTLSDVSVDEMGVITGSYSNGQSRQLAQVGLAKFANPNGLLRDGNNLFAQTQASGLAAVGAAGSGAGSIRSNSLEQSNVDIAEQFTDMILTQRIYQANSRTITTSDEMLQEVINLKR